MGVGEAVIAVGVGCRRGSSVAAILSLLRKTLAVTHASEATLYTIDAKKDEAGLLEAAAALGLPLIFLTRSELEHVAPQVRTHSPLVHKHFGLPSVSEAAALAGAGAGARLILARVAEGGVTCAVALAVSNEKDTKQ